MSREPLVVLLDGQIVGEISWSRPGRLTFRYDTQWRENPKCHPLSISLPLSQSEHIGS